MPSLKLKIRTSGKFQTELIRGIETFRQNFIMAFSWKFLSSFCRNRSFQRNYFGCFLIGNKGLEMLKILFMKIFSQNKRRRQKYPNQPPASSRNIALHWNEIHHESLAAKKVSWQKRNGNHKKTRSACAKGITGAFNLSDFSRNSSDFFSAIVSGSQWIERIEITREFASASNNKTRNKAERKCYIGKRAEFEVRNVIFIFATTRHQKTLANDVALLAKTS